MKTLSIYYGSAEEARQAGALDMYRSSAEVLRKTRDAIDAAIAANYDGLRLARRCVSDVLQDCSAEAVAVVLAATMADRSGDGRFSQAGRLWAAGQRLPEVCTGIHSGRFSCRSHSCLLDGFIGLFRASQK